MITIDFETRSESDLMKVGAAVYSEHPSTDIICVSWGIDNLPIRSWWNGDFETPEDMKPYDMAEVWDAIDEGHMIEAHNIGFERSIWKNVMTPRYRWPECPPVEQWRDTMAVAAYYAMPQALDKLMAALGYEGKDPEGYRLITRYSKLHLKTARDEITMGDFVKFVKYCERDVLLEQTASDVLGDLPDREVPNFAFDMRVMERGLKLDAEGIAAATEIVDRRFEELAEVYYDICGAKPTQVAKSIEWINANGGELLNLQAGTLEEEIERDDTLRQCRAEDPDFKMADKILPDDTRRVIELRMQLNKASTRKLDAMSRQTCEDGRAKYQTRYHGTQTGRNAGSGFQPLNLKRSYEDISPERLVKDIMFKDPAYLDMIYGDAMEAVSSASRHWIMAEEGYRIMAGDFVSVEAVVLACLAGEQWKIDAFRAGEKIYERMADKIYGYPTGTVTKATHPAERFDGKTGELAFGYQGALGAWRNFDHTDRHTDERVIEICRAWRDEHPETTKLWRSLNSAAISAVRDNKETSYREIGFAPVDDWLAMILPNGKHIWYYQPLLSKRMPRWHDPATKEDCADGTCKCEMEHVLSYMSMKNGQWTRIYTYGGKLAENATQATSREILMPAARRLERHGYTPVLTVYDEVVCEVPEGLGSLKEFEEIMIAQPEGWYASWPLSVDGWEGYRYKK